MMYHLFKGALRLFKRKPRYVYISERRAEPSLVLSNHVGTSVPLSLSLYYDKPFRFWGTYEMNSGLRSTYKYLSEIYYPQKKHWNPFLARVFSLIAAPFSNAFYKGLNLISTYRDCRFHHTVRESEKAMDAGYDLVIFPEDSKKGYFEEMTHFFAGFVFLCETRLHKGKDTQIIPAYFKKKENEHIFGEPLSYIALKEELGNREAIAEHLRDQVNALRFYKKEEIAS